VVIVFTVVLVAIVGGLLRLLVAEQRQMRRHAHELQSVWLARSGIERAMARLDESADYAGETWNIPADQIGGASAGKVVIHVEPFQGQPSRRRVRATADFPDDPVRRHRHTQQVLVDLRVGGEL